MSASRGDQRHSPAGGAGVSAGGAGVSAGRLFVAVALADEARRAIVGHLDRAIGGPLPGRPVAPENWHLTLRFLGDTPAAKLDPLLRSLRDAPTGSAFDLEFTALGAFPDSARARVIWLGTGGGADALRDLAAVVEQCAVASGFRAEERRFQAHLTLARLKPDGDVRGVVSRVPPIDLVSHVGEIRVYRSHLRPAGPHYELVRRFPLDPAPAADPAAQGAST